MVKMTGQNSLNCSATGLAVLACWAIMTDATFSCNMIGPDGEEEVEIHNECEHVRVVSPGCG
jgi:hypothetical protein